MIWPATFLGAFLGLLLGRLPGALFGALLGQALDRRLQLQHWRDLPERLRSHFAGSTRAVDEQELLFLLLGRLAKSEGAVQESHIQMARAEMQRLQLDEAAQREAIAAFGRGKSVLDSLLKRALNELMLRPQRGEALLRACWRMAFADGWLGPREQALLLQWGAWLGFRAQQVRALGQDYQPQQPSSSGACKQKDYEKALRLLGVTAGSSPAQIKRAWRRQLSLHHPDKLSGDNASREQLLQATEHTRELHEAYRLIRQRRGF